MKSYQQRIGHPYKSLHRRVARIMPLVAAACFVAGLTSGCGQNVPGRAWPGQAAQGSAEGDALDAVADGFGAVTAVKPQPVGPEGATLTFAQLPGREVKVVVPAGALDGKIALSATIETGREAAPLAVDGAAVDGAAAASPAAIIKFGPDGTKFSQPITVEVTLARPMPRNLPCLVYLRDPASGAWSPARLQDGTVVVAMADSSGKKAVFQIDHFSEIAVPSVATFFARPLALSSEAPPLLVPSVILADSVWATAGTDLVFSIAAARRAAYRQVLLELALRTERQRESAEMSLTTRLLDAVAKTFSADTKAGGYPWLLAQTKWVKLAVDDMLATGQPQALGYAKDLKAIGAAAGEIASAAKTLGGFLNLSSCVIKAVFRLIIVSAVDYQRALERAQAMAAYAKGSPLYQEDKAFREALADVEQEVTDLASGWAGKTKTALVGAASSGCALKGIQAGFEWAIGPLVAAAAGGGAALPAGLLVKFVVVDVVFKDMVGAAQRGAAMAAAGTIYTFGGLGAACAGLTAVSSAAWAAPSSRLKVLACQAALYSLSNIFKTAAKLLRLEDASTLSKGTLGLLQTAKGFLGGTTREDLAKGADDKAAEYDKRERFFTQSMGDLCAQAKGADKTLLCGAKATCSPACGGDAVCNGFGECEKPVCTPNCKAKACGASDGCGGSCVASCPAGAWCKKEGSACGAGKGKCSAGACVWTDGAGRKWGLVPAGKFYMGCNAALDKSCFSEEKPQHMVTITSSYWLGLYEVTVAEYNACVDAKQCSAPKSSSSPYANWGKSGRTQHPVNFVSWSQSQSYCKWVGGRLPTEAEWEMAARGRCEESGGVANCSSQMRVYPWGNSAPACGKTSVYGDGGGNGCGVGTTWAVGTGSTQGVGPYGHYDLAGNVWEWVSDYYSDSYYGTKSATSANPENTNSTAYRVERGGSFSSYASLLRAGNRAGGTASGAVDNLGLRCIRSHP